MAVDKDEFRNAMSRFASGVTVVTAVNEGRPWGMTVSAFSSVSLEPPLVLVCIDKKASGHSCLAEGCNFAVNVLSEEQEHLSRRFATRDADRFSEVAYTVRDSGVPLIDEAIAKIECRVVQAYPGGDHTIVVGEVVSTEVAEGKPLAYFRGGYHTLNRS
ncbi:MAG TPA: flavin reductase family protein [Blastocatellia bacterium]|nr:flavin reductase family protein [Blastocatellia bacterium]